MSTPEQASAWLVKLRSEANNIVAAGQAAARAARGQRGMRLHEARQIGPTPSQAAREAMLRAFDRAMR